MQSLQNDYLYQLETMAPKPKVRSCRHLVSDRPRYFGNEFHGKISREHSALLLRSDGEYLVRESVNESGMYCLVMKINGVLKNYRLFFDGAHYAVGDQKKFQKLTDLVEDGIIHMFIEHRAKNYIETMSKQSIYAQLKALQGEEIDLRQKASPYAEIPLDASYMTSTTSSSGISDGSDGPIYEAISDDAESIIINQPNRTTTLASKSSISNMSTGQASECSSSDSYQSPPGPNSRVEPQPKKKKGLMTSLKRSLSFSQKRKQRPKTATRQISVPNHFPNYEKSHDFKVTTYKGKRYCAYCGNYMWGLIEQGLQCGDCGINAHKQCARLIPHDCCPNPKLVQRLFGASLVTLVKLYGTQRPVIVNLCVQELERRDVLKLRGLYRENGDTFDIERIRNQFDNDLGSVNLAAVDTYTVASLLKLYLRELPEPLVQTELYPRFLNAIKQNDFNMTVKMTRTALDLLHPAHYSTLSYLVEHLERVASQAHHNMMNETNLATCFGPVIFRAAQTSTNFSKEVEEAQIQKELVAFLIRNRKQLFQL